MNTYYVAGIPYTSELYHHGIKGQKWGIRRFQNPDGTLTEAGRDRYYGNRNFNEKGELSRKGIDRRADNLSKLHKALSETELGYDRKRLSSKDIKNRDYLKRLSKELGEDEVKRAYDLSNAAKEQRFKNKNPFKSNRLYKEMIDKENAAQLSGVRYSARFMDATMDYVKHMNKRERQLALTYVYQLLGYDW